MTPTVLWLIGGVVCIVLEIFAVPGIGFLFAGLGALLVGGAVEAGVIAPDDLPVQLLIFFTVTCVTAALLWKRLRQHRGPNYHNMIGTEAVVADGGLSGRQEGQVKWSGTLMRARLSENAGVDVLAAESIVIIRRVEGNLLFVAPKEF